LFKKSIGLAPKKISGTVGTSNTLTRKIVAGGGYY